MIDNWIKKGLVCALIILFICVAIRPGISTNTVQDEKTDLVEVTVSLCKINGIENQTKFLTQQQIEHLYNIFNKLKNVNTQGEIINVYNEAIESLDLFDLLPDDLNIEDAHQLITSNNLYLKINKFIKTLDRKYNSDKSNNATNYFCLVFGNTKGVSVFNFEFNIFYPISIIMEILYNYLRLNIFHKLAFALFLYAQLKPFHFMNLVGILNMDWGVNFSFCSLGLLGFKHTIVEPQNGYALEGFTGFTIKTNCQEYGGFLFCDTIYLGSALKTEYFSF